MYATISPVKGKTWHIIPHQLYLPDMALSHQVGSECTVIIHPWQNEGSIWWAACNATTFIQVTWNRVGRRPLSTHAQALGRGGKARFFPGWRRVVWDHSSENHFNPVWCTLSGLLNGWIPIVTCVSTKSGVPADELYYLEGRLPTATSCAKAQMQHQHHNQHQKRCAAPHWFPSCSVYLPECNTCWLPIRMSTHLVSSFKAPSPL